MSTWITSPLPEISAELRAAAGGSDLVAQVLGARGFGDPARARAFLDPAAYHPALPLELPDMAKAVARLQQALRRDELIAVWGDFDVDGQTATTLLLQGLRALGGRVITHIPARSDGHGLHLPALEALLAAGAGLVLTCDTGVDAHAAVDYAAARGVDVVITDHHDLPERLPAAYAVVNPKRLPADHPLAGLPGVGVAWKLVEALDPGVAAQHVDLAALGIVADVAVQTDDTRALLQRGLRQLRHSPRQGVQALLRVAEVNPAQLNEDHISFELAPRLNALGRLGDANQAVTLLSTTDPQEAAVLATLLDGLNGERKRLTEQIFQGALAQIEQEPALLDSAALVLANPAWHPGIIGIVASRLAERYRRPVVLLAAPPGELARGSARSVAGCNISTAIATQQALLVGFGGHPMAAGLRIEATHIGEFRRGLDRAVRSQTGVNPAEAVITIDALLPLAELTLDVAADLERLAPFGSGNPPVTLLSPDHAVAHKRTVGRNQNHRLLTLRDAAGQNSQVMWWQGAAWPLPEGRFDLAYTVRAASYRGQPQVQVAWVDARPRGDVFPAQQAEPRSVLDYRRAAQPQAFLDDLRRGGAVQVWREATAASAVAGEDRTALSLAPVLAIWTTPPDRATLAAALAVVQPQQVALFAVDPQMDDAETFLARLAGLVKYTLAHDGQTTWQRLAAATAQSIAAVQAGLHWLVARGYLHLELEVGDSVWLRAGANVADPAAAAAALNQVGALLAESAAFRRYFNQAATETLLE
ncbi:MAG: single-stranded-DNA-specific exonuclease RecJ [Caldilineales bacterium]